MVKKVIKDLGYEEDFVKEKIVVSCYNAGLDLETARKIADEVEEELKDKEVVTTDEIREVILKKLDKHPEIKLNYILYAKLVKGRYTYEGGRIIEVPKGPLYLGRSVKDVGEKGLSDVCEVEGILKELEEDLEHGIPRSTIHRRTYILLMAVLRSRKLTPEEKKKCIELINEFRKKHGWKPFTLKRPIE